MDHTGCRGVGAEQSFEQSFVTLYNTHHGSFSESLQEVEAVLRNDWEEPLHVIVPGSVL